MLKYLFVSRCTQSGAGTYDNRGGYDYHLPVVGSPVSTSLAGWSPDLLCAVLLSVCRPL
jgi:hypothetical protein